MGNKLSFDTCDVIFREINKICEAYYKLGIAEVMERIFSDFYPELLPMIKEHSPMYSAQYLDVCADADIVRKDVIKNIMNLVKREE